MANSNSIFSFLATPSLVLLSAASLLCSTLSIAETTADGQLENTPLLSKRIYWKSLTLNLSNKSKANVFLDTRLMTYTSMGEPVISCVGTWKLNWYQGNETSGIGRLNRDEIPRSVLDQLLLNNVKIQYSVSQKISDSDAKYIAVDCDLGNFYKEGSPRPSFNVPQKVAWKELFRIDDPKSRPRKPQYASTSDAKRYFAMLTEQKKLTNSSARANMVLHASVNDYPIIKWHQQLQAQSNAEQQELAAEQSAQALVNLKTEQGLQEQNFHQFFADLDLQIEDVHHQQLLQKSHKRHQAIFNQKRRKNKLLEQQSCIDVPSVKTQVNDLKSANLWMDSLATCTKQTDFNSYSAAPVNKKEQGGTRFLYCQVKNEQGAQFGKFTPSKWVETPYGYKGYYSVADCDVKNIGNGFMVIGLNVVIDKDGNIIEFPEATDKAEQEKRVAKLFRRGSFQLCSETSDNGCRVVPLTSVKRINTENWSIEDWIEYQKTDSK